jgi:hypothetical protein
MNGGAWLTVEGRRAARFWAEAARLTLDDTETVYAARGDALGCAGGLAPRFARLGGTPAALREAVRDVRAALVAVPDLRPGHDG